MCHLDEQHDENSASDPPTGVLLAGLWPLTSNAALKRHIAQYGTVVSFEAKIDSENAMPLGLVYVKFATGEEARKCVEKENGKKGGLMGVKNEEEWTVMVDRGGKVLRALM